MPVYSFHCKVCKIRFERLCPDTREQPSCPQCGRAAKRVYRSCQFILKGRGFHATDYGPRGSRKAT